MKTVGGQASRDIGGPFQGGCCFGSRSQAKDFNRCQPSIRDLSIECDKVFLLNCILEADRWKFVVTLGI
ncbi:hypothetical protein O6P43_023735 [Quillaja saponaria]|uniref:Uncharacterized protein n=1 Tax=Quillaja saponaria TaxID=32244 RepID=A0AAD7LG91_QUISA|nr:hypothetical protein O6P43_023735 [Quillaja saponaria]